MLAVKPVRQLFLLLDQLAGLHLAVFYLVSDRPFVCAHMLLKIMSQSGSTILCTVLYNVPHGIPSIVRRHHY